MSINVELIKKDCLEKWQEGYDADNRLRDFSNNFDECMEKIPDYAKEFAIILIKNLEYYSHPKTNKWLVELHNRLKNLTNVNDENTVYAFIKSKDGKRRKVGIQKEEKVFNFSYSNCQQYLGKACVTCGLPKYTHHEFRHTFISNLIRQSVSLPVIEMVSGDTQLTILKTYSHVFQRDELIILDALEKSKKLGNFKFFK